MNKELYEKYADKLLEAMKAEKLMNKEVAEIFGVPASYMSDMRKHPEKVSGLFMEKIRTWSISGKPLREYKLPTSPDTEAAEINQQQADEAREKAEMKFRSKLAVKALAREHHAETAAAIAQSVDTESPNVSSTARQEIAAALRKEYDRQNPETEMKIVAHKDGKVDVSRLDPRTGQVAAYELQIMDDGSLHISYRFKS
jgi:hypothetical protein